MRIRNGPLQNTNESILNESVSGVGTGREHFRSVVYASVPHPSAALKDGAPANDIAHRYTVLNILYALPRSVADLQRSASMSATFLIIASGSSRRPRPTDRHASQPSAGPMK